MAKEKKEPPEAAPEAAEPKIFFEPKDPKVRIGHVAHAHYSRDFSAEKPPYAAKVEEWEKFLLPTGLFREAKKE